MAGWNTITQIRKLEERADGLGMRFTAYKHGDMYGEHVALVPKDKDALPIYCRDAILFAGSLVKRYSKLKDDKKVKIIYTQIKNNKILIITMFGMVIALERTSKYRAKSRGGYSSLIWGLPDGG